MRIEKERSLSYDDIGIVSEVISEINSRSDIEPVVEFCGKLIYPMIGSPMPDVCDGKMALELSRLKCYGFIHRFQSIQEQIEDYNYVVKNGGCAGCAIPLNDWEERYAHLKDFGCNSFLIDCANGASRRVIDVVEKIVENCYLTVGNIHSSKTFNELSKLGVYAIRVGISGGYACSTKLETGIYRPMISTLMDVYENKIGDAIVIADGGIKSPSDMNKALMWSDVTMLGGVFAQCPQSPARVVKVDGHLKKVFRGAASYSTQLDYKGEKPTYVEGMEHLVDLGSSIDSVVQRFINGLRSSMSYLNAKTLNEYRDNALICIV